MARKRRKKSPEPKKRSRITKPEHRSPAPTGEVSALQRWKARLILHLVFFPDFFIVTLVALVTAFYRLTATSLWADEGNSVAQALRPVPELIRHAALDIHPPLYYLMLHFWVRIFGTSEFALRSLSALAGVAVVLLIWAIVDDLWGGKTAFLAGLIAALHPALIYYAQEVRMYIFLALWAALAAYALVHIILQEGRTLLRIRDHLAPFSPQHPSLLLGKWDVLFILALAAGLWTHYTFPLMIGVFGVAYVAWILSTRRSIPVVPRIIRMSTHYVGALVLYTPWLPIMLERVHSWPRPNAVLPPEVALSRVWTWLTLGPIAPSHLQSWSWLWAALLLIALWPWRRRTQTGYRRPHWLAWGFPLLWLGLPVAAMMVGHLFKPAYLKFLIVGIPPFVILLARGAFAPWEGNPPQARSWRYILALLWLLGSAVTLLTLEGLALNHYYTHADIARDDYRGIVRYIEAVADEGDAVILNAPGQWDVFHYYYHGELPVYLLPEHRPPIRAEVERRLQDIAARHDKLFVLLWATDESDPEGIVENWLDTHAYKALDVWRGNVRFLIYALPATSEQNAWTRDMDVTLGEHIRLKHVAIWDWEVPPGNVVQVRLLWTPEAPIPARYKVFLQLLGPGDRLIAQRDSEPVGGSRPTDTWQPGETVVDNYGLLIPLATPPGTYRLIAGMYDPQTGERLTVRQGGRVQDHVEFPLAVTVLRPRHAPPVEVLPIQHRVDEQWGPIRLLGYNHYKRGYRHAPDTPLHPGDFLHITAFWQATDTPRDRWRVTFSLIDAWGNIIATLTDDPVGPAYPTPRWHPGDILRGEFDLYIPPETKPGPYGLQIQVWKNDQPVREPVPLGAVQISE